MLPVGFGQRAAASEHNNLHAGRLSAEDWSSGSICLFWQESFMHSQRHTEVNALQNSSGL